MTVGRVPRCVQVEVKGANVERTAAGEVRGFSVGISASSDLSTIFVFFFCIAAAERTNPSHSFSIFLGRLYHGRRPRASGRREVQVEVFGPRRKLHLCQLERRKNAQ